MSDAFVTFAGGGFGTVVVEASAGDSDVPAPATQRRLLRDGLPAIHREDAFLSRFLEGLEGMLDPIVAVLDSLPAHFQPDHAPRDVLTLLTAWLGLEHDESRRGEERRELVRHAAELGRARGTADGLALALRLAFPDLPLRVQDDGCVRTARDPAELGPAPPFQVVVYCDEPIAPDRQAAVARLIERVKPVGTGYRLRVRAARGGAA